MWAIITTRENNDYDALHSSNNMQQPHYVISIHHFTLSGYAGHYNYVNLTLLALVCISSCCKHQFPCGSCTTRNVS